MQRATSTSPSAAVVSKSEDLQPVPPSTASAAGRLYTQNNSQPPTAAADPIPPFPWRSVVSILLVNLSEPLAITLLFPFAPFLVADYVPADQVGVYAGLLATTYNVAGIPAQPLLGPALRPARPQARARRVPRRHRRLPRALRAVALAVVGLRHALPRRPLLGRRRRVPRDDARRDARGAPRAPSRSSAGRGRSACSPGRWSAACSAAPPTGRPRSAARCSTRRRTFCRAPPPRSHPSSASSASTCCTSRRRRPAAAGARRAGRGQGGGRGRG